MFIIYFWERDTEWEQGRGRERERERERERDTESQAGPRLRAVSTEPDVGLEPTDREIMTWAEVGRTTNWAPQGPLFFVF